MTLEIYTPCFYDNTQPIERLAKSCERLGYALIPYGVGELWPGLVNAEIIRFRQTIERSTADLVCRADGADGWFIRPPESLLDAFEFYGKDVLIGGERQCWPFDLMHHKFDYERQYPYPNGGNVIGKRESVKAALDELVKLSLPEHCGNDQAHWLTWLPQDNVAIDTDCRAFFSTSNDNLTEMCGRDMGRLLNKATYTYPCLVHFNGGGKDERIAEFERLFG